MTEYIWIIYNGTYIHIYIYIWLQEKVEFNTNTKCMVSTSNMIRHVAIETNSAQFLLL
jgi:hypothetical protein